MSEPTVADTKPTVMELEPGDYWWCSCGKSANQPFCNGAHKGTEFVPLKFTVEEKKPLPFVCVSKQAISHFVTAATVASKINAAKSWQAMSVGPESGIKFN